jgi:hypothetical protein
MFRGFVRFFWPPFKVDVSDDEALRLMKDGLESQGPFLCARLGCTELQTIAFVRLSQKPVIGWMLKPFWNGVIYSIENSSGVYNSTPSSLCDFANLYEDLFPEIDVLGSWHQSERFFCKYFSGKQKINMSQFYPNFINSSWTALLKGKKVLVVHPFAESIRSQYEKREELFDDPEVLPEFKSLYVLKAVQSIAGNVPSGFETWFDALDYMRDEMKKIDYDIALIACGAYGFPLGAYAKQCGKKAIVVGGVLQLLFGIKGKRWLQYDSIKRIMDKPSWVWPSESETPRGIERVPGSGYW